MLMLVGAAAAHKACVSGAAWKYRHKSGPHALTGPDDIMRDSVRVSNHPCITIWRWICAAWHLQQVLPVEPPVTCTLAPAAGTWNSTGCASCKWA